METSATPVTTTAIGIRYGLLTGLVGVIVSFILNMTQLEQSPAKWLSLVVLTTGTVLAQQFYKKMNAGFMGYGQGMSIGIMLAAVVSVINAVFSFVYTHFIDTNMVARILDKVRADMETRPGVTDDQLDQAMGWTAKIMTEPIMSLVVITFFLFWGVVISLIVSAIVKNPKPEFE